MKIQKIIETENGPVTFVADLSSEQYNFIFEVGLKFLISQGAAFFQMKDEIEVSQVAPSSEEVQ